MIIYIYIYLYNTTGPQGTGARAPGHRGPWYGTIYIIILV